MSRFQTLAVVFLALAATAPAVMAQEAKLRFDQACQVRRDKFDIVLPRVMRDNGIDMWIVAEREGHYDPNTDILGAHFPNESTFFVFTDRGGDRIERATFNVVGNDFAQCDVYDLRASPKELRKFVAERNPKRIGLNMGREIGTADGLSHTMYLQLVETLGEPLASRFVSAEKLVSDLRSQHVPMEIAHFAEAGEMSRQIVEQALSNEIITPSKTTLGDVAWWMWDETLRRGAEVAFGLPSVSLIGPTRGAATSDDHIIQPGDFIQVDWGVKYRNKYTDMKRLAYVLKPGEQALPKSLQVVFDKGREARTIVAKTIRPGITAGEAYEAIQKSVGSAPGLRMAASYTQPSDDQKIVDIFVGSHSVGDFGHGSGPSVAAFNPLRMTYQLQPTNLLSIELFVYGVVPEWGTHKIKFGLEDDAVVTERGVEWVYPINERILLIR